MYRLSSCSSPSIRTREQLNGKYLPAKAHITKFKQLTESEVTELTSSMVDETALTILRRQGSRLITIVSSKRNFELDLHLSSILTELKDQMLQTGSKGL